MLTLAGRRIATPRLVLAPLRRYRATPAVCSPYKDTQDRESLKPEGAESTKSGRDADVATNNPEAAFKPSKTSPEEARRTGGPELEFSGANKEVSKPQGKGTEASGGKSPPKKGTSG